MKSKEIITKNELCSKGKVHIMNFFDKGNIDTMDSWEQKEIFFNAGSWQKDLSLAPTGLTWYFKDRDRWSFSSQKNDKMIFFSMEYHVYWLLKSSYFELSGDGKYGFFLSLKVDWKMILLITEKFLFWNFVRWGIWPF